LSSATRLATDGIVRLAATIALLLVLSSFPLRLGAASVFESTGVDGEVSFSDRSTPGALELALPPVQTYDAPSLPSAVIGSSDTEDQVPDGYTEFKILAPSPGETFRNNGGKVAFRFALAPGLRVDDQLRLFMDGSAVVEGHTTSMSLDNVDRGEHTVYAEVVDKRGKSVARSGAVHFYLHRTSIPNLFRAVARRRSSGPVPPSAPSR